MTIQECYDFMGGDYSEVAGRFVTAARVEKFAKMFLRDTSFEMLKQTMQAKDYKEAFRASHTLKGVCQNLALKSLENPVVELTDLLRNYETMDVSGETGQRMESLMEMIETQYGVVISAISQL